ncbi:Bug family tripartite tricarboxylate transporter substrate binding protein [Bordetella genomosp. 9]|nr:tripartite tricarboxylate transporter substrate binding protein [Bordetella genomosp. 9]
MTINRRTFVMGIPALAMARPALSLAQGSFPDRPIRLIVPFVAGGGASVIARLISTVVAQDMNANIIVENRPGAGGNVATEYVARSAPDGYTILNGTLGTQAINPNLYKNVNFDPIKDFSPISRVTTTPNVLVVNPNVPAHTLQELLALAKQMPGKLNYGSGGSGTTTHLSGEMLRTMTGINIVHVPYRGDGPAIVDLLANRVQMMFGNLNGMTPLIQTKQVRPLAITSLQRWPTQPDIPTFDEQGVKGYEISGWTGWLAPAGTPQPVIDKLNKALRQALDNPSLQAQLKQLGLLTIGDTPEQFKQVEITDLAKWKKVVADSGASVD